MGLHHQNIGRSPLSRFKPAELKWDDSKRPRSVQYGDIYFSNDDPVGESDYVFLEKNQLKQRWQNLDNERFTLIECGFGSGLNFLNTCKLWCNNSPLESSLHYIACENHPISKKDLQCLHKQWPQFSTYSKTLLRDYPDHTPGIHRLHLDIEDKHITLDLLYGDACECLNSIFLENGFRVDSWFLDGFSPKLNPQMWSSNLFQIIAKLSKKSTTLSTYSVAGHIRRGLEEVGFKVNKDIGFAKKRHMLTAMFEAPLNITPHPCYPPWFKLPMQSIQSKTAVVIGAGLAGCSTAYALANKGWKVIIVERNKQIASMASGNPLGVVHFKTTLKPSSTDHFSQLAWLYAIRQYRRIEEKNPIGWRQCGMIQLAYTKDIQDKQESTFHQGHYSKALLRTVSPAQASQIAQTDISIPGMYFPDAGLLNPQQLCKAYCRHPNVSVQTETEALEIIKQTKQWHIKTKKQENEDIKLIADAVIIANSFDAKHLKLCEHYPLIPNSGQVDFYQASTSSQTLNTVLCTKGYITPSMNQYHTVGGSFNSPSTDNRINLEDKMYNLKQLKSTLSSYYKEFSCQQNVTSRSSIRCSTSDYLPIVGPVEDLSSNQKVFHQLRLNAKAKINQAPIFHEGLFVNIGHGSHGLTTTPLVAEYLASLINKDALPLSKASFSCLHPIRFLIRNLKKQKA